MDTVTGCTKEFWCIEMDCSSYNNGEKCGTCEKNGKCEHCVLQSTANKPDGCADEAYYIQYGYPEEVE